jgi:hypothetical protein
MNDYLRATADRDARLKSLNAGSRSVAAFGYRGQAEAAGDGHADAALLDLKLKRGAVIPIDREYAGDVGAVDVSFPIRQIMQTRPQDAARALYELAPALREQFRDTCKGKFVSAAGDIPDDLIVAFAQILEE